MLESLIFIILLLNIIIRLFQHLILFQGLIILFMNSLQLLGITSQEKFNKSYFFKNFLLFNNSFYWKINTFYINNEAEDSYKKS